MEFNDRAIDDLLAAAIEAQAVGDNRAALAALHRAGELDPGNVNTMIRLGHAYLDLEQYTAALEAFGRAVRSFRGSGGAYAGRAQALQALGRLAEAEVDYQHAISLTPTAARWVLLGDVQTALGKDAEAEGAFRAALRLDPQYDEALFNLAVLVRNRDRVEALALLKRATAVDPLFGDAHRELGFEQLRIGKVSEAEHAIRTAIALNDQDAWAHVYLGHLLSQTNRNDEAVAALGIAARTAPLWALPEYLLGLHYKAGGDLASAEEHFTAATERDTADGDAAFNLGRFLAEVGRIEEARLWLRRAVQVDPDHRRARKLLHQLDQA